jgi:nucleoside-diphosphate-sugar epimerase
VKVLVTGAAGFIVSAVSLRLLERGDEVIGIDNHNDDYSLAPKEARLALIESYSNYTHVRIDLDDRTGMEELFDQDTDLQATTIAAAITHNLISLRAEQLAEEALRIMESRNINCILVTDKDGHYVGALNMLDLAHAREV